MPRIWVKELQFSSGDKISLKNDDIVVLVGANNSGKTTTLRDIYKNLETTQNTSVAIKVDAEKEGSTDDLLKWLQTNSLVNADSNGKQYIGLNASARENQAVTWWADGLTKGFQSLRNFFCLFADTERRLAMTTPAANNVDSLSGQPSHPSHVLLADDTFERELCTSFRKAFGFDLILHRGGGSTLPFFVGTAPTRTAGEDRVSATYLQKLAVLPKLHEQGDGMRGFAAVLLSTMAKKYSLLMIDEPSVFLHPPQARILGKAIVETASTGAQIMMSTHDGDFLRGILDIGSKRVKVIRLQRTDNINTPTLLSNEDIGSVWANSLLKHSNVLDALFHEVAIICESDSDALFYAAVLDIVYSGKEKKKPDSMFIHGGGKGRIPLLVSSLKKLNVPIRVICDIDVLRDLDNLEAIVISLQADFNLIKSEAKELKALIDNKDPSLTTTEVFSQLANLMESFKQEYLSSHIKNKIGKVVKRSSPWSKVKELGIESLGDIEIQQKYESLTLKLSRLGLFVVNGEIETFDTNIKDHGPAWVAKALDRDLSPAETLAKAKDFVEKAFDGL